MKLYKGVRAPLTYKAIVYVDDTLLDISLSKSAVHDYGADAPEWGYYGSGPSQTAAAILLDVTGDAELTKKYHQEFKREFIANFDQNSFILLEMQIRMWLDQYKRSEEEGLW